MVKFTEADRHIIEVSISAGVLTGELLVAAVNNLLDDYELLKASLPPVPETDSQVGTLTGKQLPINWDAVTLHTQEVKHYFIPNQQSTALLCEVCGQSELASIHIQRKEYQR